MAAREVGRNVGAAHFNHDNGGFYGYKCLHCAESAKQLKEMHLELSSLQPIVKLLYKEINSSTTISNMAGNTNSASSFSSKGSGVNTDAHNRWALVTSNRYNSTRRQENITQYPLAINNRYALLASQETNGPHVSTHTPDTQDSQYNSKPHHDRTTVQCNYGKPQRSARKNCQLLPSIEKSYVSNLKECRRNNGLKARHKIIIIRDSHARGITAELQSNLNNDFVTYGIVKPGSDLSAVLNSVPKEMEE
jgi:hypothetical protein